MAKLKISSKQNIADILGLTPLQEGLLFHYLKNPGSDYYFEQLRLRISGPLDTVVFERAWNTVVETNEMLRTVFRWEKLENPVQLVLKKHPAQWRYYDFSSENFSEAEKRLEQALIDDWKEKFDLREAAFRVTLCKIAAGTFQVIISNHHILYDGWSNGIILKEFFNAYRDISRGKEPIKPVKSNFKEFIEYLQQRDKEQEQRFWQEYLAGFEGKTEISQGRKDRETDDKTGTALHPVRLPAHIANNLEAAARSNRVSAAAFLYTAWGLLLQRYCNCNDVIFGITVSGRSAKVKAIEEMVGLFIATLPLRVHTHDTEKVEDLLNQINHILQILEANEHTPPADISRYSESGGAGELFDSIVVIENYPLDARLTGGTGDLAIDSYSLKETAHYGLTLVISLFAGIEITFNYFKSLWEDRVIRRMAGHFLRILEEVTALPGKATNQIEMLSQEEKQQLLEAFNDTGADYPHDKTIHRLFEEQAVRMPDRIALVGAIPVETLRATSLQTTYRQLNEQSDQVAGLLIEKGVLADDIAAIMMERSIEMIIGILGILKAGGAYMPIDLEYPQDRIDYMLKDCGAKLMIGRAEERKSGRAEFVFSSFFLASSLPRFLASNSSNLAYIIYTSGTTGRPKGVIVEHRNVLRLVKNTDYVEFRAGDRILQTGALEFDASTFEIWGALLNGLMLFLVKKEQVLSPAELRKAVETYDIAMMWLTSSLFNRLSEADIEIFAPLRNLLVGGEALSPAHINKLRRKFAHLNIINGYGPTENTTFSTTYRVDREYNDNIPIGRPIANSTAYIVNRWNRLQPVGVVGELYVGGHGVARGYLNNVELTADKFNRSYRSNRTYILYKTGDLARWLNGGDIEFVGRIDSQLKIRGFRIEPGEIERRLLEHKDIKEAIVIDRLVNEEKCLCAYIVGQKEKAIDITELRQYLSHIMPGYMIPSYFTVMARLPLTANGKVDRKALPEPIVKPSEHFVAYRDEIEESLAEIWSHTLGIEKEKIGIDDNFFAWGGHSLKAMQLAGRVHKYFDVNIPVTAIFAAPTIRGLANYIKSHRTAAAVGDFEPLEAVEEREHYELSFGQQRIYMIQQMDPRSTAFHISSAIELVGEVEPGKLREVFKKMILRHESLRTSFIQVEGKPVQRVLEPTEVEFDIEYYDLATEDTEDTEGKNHHSLFMNTSNHFIRPFDLSRAPLLRVGLFKNHDGKSILLIDIHHIVADGTSVDILTAEFQAFRSGRELPFPLIQYKDFCQWQSRLSRREEMKNHEKYWLQQLKGQLPLLPMPTDYPRPEEQNLEGDYVYYSLEKELSLKVRQYLRETGATLYMLLLTVFNILLYRYTGQEDIIIGSPIAGREHADLERVVGLLIGSLPMRNFPRECKTFSGFLEEIKRNTLQAYEHRWYPYEEILRKVNYTAHAGRNPISDISLIVQNTNTGNRGQRLSRSKSHEDLFPKTSKVDMTLIVEENAGDIFLSLEYRTGLFKRESMERCLQHFVHLLENGIADSTAYLSFIEMTSLEEKLQFIGAVEKCYPLSHPQKRIYFTEKRYHGTPAATLGFVVRYEEILDMDLLETAINRVIEKNDSMRLRIVEFPFEKEPRQYVAPFERQSIDFIDFSINGKDNEDFLRQWLEENRGVPFEFLNRNLFYFVRLRFNKKETGYYLKVHHIIADGLAANSFLPGQIDHIYVELKAGRNAAGGSYPSYLRYLSNEREYLNSDRAGEDNTFWRGILLPLPPAVRLSTGESDIFNIKSGISKFILPPSVMGDIHKYVQSPGTKTSIYKLLFSVFSIFISKAADLSDFVIGSASHNRIDDSMRQAVGMFASTIPIRMQVDENQVFHTFVEKNGIFINTIIKNYQQYPFDLLAVQVGEEIGVDLNYLLDINFISLGNMQTERYKVDAYFPRYDQDQLTIYLCHKPGDHILELEWNYRESLFTPFDISRMHKCMMVILEDALRNPGKKIKELELLSPGEKRQILEDFNDNESPSPFPSDLPLHELFSRQVERVSGRAAVVGAETNHHVSYRQVDEQSGNLAFLLHERGVVPGDIVAVVMEPSEERIIILLGILKAGAAYLPIDPQCPQERIDYMLKDCGAEIVVNEKFFRGARGAVLQKSPPDIANLAYIIYTSGSTGRPKGVAVAHRNVIAYLTAFDKEFQLKETDTVIQQASYTFDAFVEEMYPVLLKGGKLAVPSRATVTDIHLLVEFIARYSVAMITCSPLLLDRLNNLDSYESLRGVHTFISGGDLLHSRFIDKLLKVGKVYNTYGPTESTVCVTYYRCPEGIEGNVPIGKPIANYKVYILDRNRRLVPPGIPGELCVAGPGVAMGYLNRPELTAEKYNRSYRSYKTYILYKTGDLCKWLLNGNIEFLGRIDHQVKIRGFRIESGEIEARLLENPAIEKAVVLAREDKGGDRNLTAYIVSRPDISVTAGMLREYLAGTLPDYMLPSHFVFLAQIPLTPGGKVDRRALPGPGTKEEPDNYTAPRNEIEKQLAAIWSEVLLIPRIGIDDNFFHSGGHSLKASIMTARVLKILNIKAPLAEIFRRPTIRELGRYISAEEKSQFAAPAAAEEKEYYQLSPGQKRLYLVYRMDVENTGYNISTALELEGDIDHEKLQATFRELIRRHESFRTSFFMAEEEPVQRIHPPDAVKFEIQILGVRGQGLGVRPFDLSCAPLLRVGLARIEAKKHLLLVDMHHIIADGVSLAILVKEFTALYAGAHLPALKLRYRDYAEWRNREKTDAEKQQEKYWLAQFETGDIPVLNLPLDYPRPAIQDFAGSRQRFEVREEDAGALRSLAAHEGTTLFMLLLALFNVLLAKLSGQQDIIVGTPTAGRNHADLQDIIGMFVNTLALRNFPIAEKPFDEFLLDVKERTLAAFENQEYPFENLVERLKINRDTGRNPLFDVAFVSQNMDIPKVHIPGLKFKPYDFEKETSIFDITWQAFESGPTLLFIIEFSTKLFQWETIRRFTGYWLNLVRQACLTPTARSVDMDILSPEEKNLLLYGFNETEYEYPEHKTIHELFVEQVDKTPDNIAVVETLRATSLQLTYRQLNEQSGRLAGMLIEKGVLVGDIVGIMVERSIEMVVGILGILKAGGAYLPIDPSYPKERVKFMLEESGAKLLAVANDKEGEKVRRWEGEKVLLKEILKSSYPLTFLPSYLLNSSNLAYIIYTSGTTGCPKGVMVEHRSVVRLVKNTDYVEFRAGDRILQTGALEFDASTFEIWGAVLNGLMLFLVKKEHVLSPIDLRNAVEKYDIRMMWLTSSLFNRLSEADIEIFAPLRNLLVGGEALSPAHINKLRRKFAHLNIINGYGPTENTTFSTTYRVDKEYNDNIPIGRPIANSTAYIVDRWNRLQPLGVAGELYVGGHGVARGYLNNVELTAEKFIKNRSYRTHKTYIFYKTGDLCRWLPGGNIEFLGRIDGQVKLRGFRIELGEIESRLTAHDDIKEAVVVLKEKNLQPYLCAYFVPVREASVSVLREYLSGMLPAYMIPSYFVPMDRIPLTPSGKADRNALPDPEIKSGDDYVAPSDETEWKLAQIWSEVLGIDKNIIGSHDDFFQLGGHSLKAAILTAKIQKAFNVKIKLTDIFVKPTLKSLSQYIKGAEGEAFQGINTAEKREYYPSTPAQKRLFVLQQMDLSSVSYNIPAAFIMEGELDPQTLADISRKMIRRHESLRTSFMMVNDDPVQRIHENVAFEIEYKNIATDEHGQTRTLIKDFIRPFDLSCAPLLRMGLMKVREYRHLLMLDVHHIVADGTSLGVFVKEFMAFHSGMELPVPKIQYKDFALWQNSFPETGKMQKQENYWMNQFEGEIPTLNLPVDFLRPAVQNFEGSTLKFEVGEDNTASLRALAIKEEATLYMLFLSIFNVLLSRLSSQEDIIVGVPTAGRRHADLQQVIGMFVNTLALRNIPSANKTFIEFLGEVKQRTLDAFENQEYPLESLVEKVVVNRDPGRNPLFDMMFVLQNLENVKIEIPGLVLRPFEYQSRISKFDLTLIGVEDGKKVVFTVEYCTALFKEETIKRFIGYLNRLLSSVVEEPGQKIFELEIIPGEEKKQILSDFNDAAYESAESRTINGLLAEQVERTPDRIALVGANRHLCVCPVSLTYRQLNEQSDQVAGLLIEKGVLVGSIVGIMLERSVEMIIGILGILKSGGAYLPIDPSYPQERIQYMLEDSNARVLLGMEECQKKIIVNCELLMGRPRRGLHHSSFIIHHSNQLAYIIYTSGSTGKPKGVMVEHRNVIRVVKNTNYIDLTFMDRILQLSNYAFDGSVFDIFGALLNGAVLVMISREAVLAVDRVSEIIEREGITVFFITTALFNTLVDLEIGCFDRIRKVLFGGERVSVEHAGKALDYLGKGRIIHVYGPTETTVYAAHYFIDAVDDYSVTIPIGKPISNTSIYIVDKNLKPVPIGVSGEIYIGGNGVARGYLNNPELTAERFLRNYRSYKSYRTYICYKTGDLARWLLDGNIEFLGRIDHQIKLRGFRVELGEIESRLSNYTGIKEAVVLAREDGGVDKYLCAYIIPDSQYNAAGIREFLSKEFPDYMIPSYFVQLEKIPLTPNGKIDRKALPKPELKVGQDYVAPRNKIEAKLVGLWAELLNIRFETISIDKNFFELGGHSLKAAVLASRLHKEMNIQLPLAVLFKTPTIRGLSEYIMGKLGAEDIYESIIPVEEKEYYSLSFAQKRLYVLQQMDVGSVSYNIPAAFILEGEPDRRTLEKTFREILKRHESLRTSFIMVNDEPVQRVHEDVEFEIEYYYPATGEHGRTQTFLKEFIRPFALSKASLLRVGLLKLADREYLLMLDMHHIIADGTSLGVFAKEFMALYSGTELPGLKIQYKDFASWQISFRETGKMQKHENYWLSQFEGELPTLNLLTDFLRPAAQSFEGSSLKFEVGEVNTAALRALAMKEGVTLYMLILAIFNVLLSRLASQEDIILGTPTAGRRHADLQQLVGMFVNTLALRNFPSANKTFGEFLGEVKQSTLKAFENQEYPFEDLVEKFVVNRDPGRNPLFDVMFVLQNLDNVAIGIPDLILKPYEYQSTVSKFDLTLIAIEDGNKVVFTIEYCIALFKDETIKRLTGYFNQLISSLVGEPGQKIYELEIIPGEERRRILYDFNDTEYEYPVNKTIHGLFEEQAEQNPDRVAVFGEPVRPVGQVGLTYKKLNEQSNRMAGLLIEKGVLVDDIVAVIMERSIEMVAAMLAVLKASGAYLPIDPSYPRERIDYMLKDSAAKIMIGREEFVFSCFFPASPLPRFLASNASNLAYIIYTSGSTGWPKGVLVRHQGFINLIYYHRGIFGEGRGMRMSQAASSGFDAMAFEVWPCLAGGATLYIVDEITRLDPARMKQWLIEKEIGISFQPTVMAEQLLDEDWPKEGVALKVLRTAGDKLTRYPARKYPFKLYNLYGPTEDTVWTTWTEVPMKPDAGGVPTVGKPIGNHRIYITGPNLEILPLCVPGELCIGGVGLAVGYLNRPELTSEKFNRSYRSNRTYIFYKTGDLCRWLPCGNIEFLGRIDGQVKLRGFRIELGEIESRLTAHVDIKEAVVVLKEKNRQSYLCAYFVPLCEIVVSELRDYLAGTLPAYMIPSYFVPVDRIPLTPNGKVDRRTLPEPLIKTGDSFEAPGNFVEEKLVEIWQEVLGVEGIGIYDNFFEVGGDSIKGVQIVSRLQRYGLKMEVADLFLHPTIKGAAASIKKLERIADQGTVTGLLDQTPIQRWFFENDFTNSHHFNQAVMVYREPGFDEAVVRRVFQEIVEHHDALRMVYEKKNLKVVQRNRGLEGRLFDFEVFDFQNKPGLEREIEKQTELIQASINLETGPLVHLGLFRTGKGDHLLMVVHHLVIDGVSWRILLEDFAAGYRRALKGYPVKFQAKTDSFIEWARGLMKYAGSERLLKELEYWNRVENGDPLPKDMQISKGEKKLKNFETIELKLSEEETEKLMRRVHRAYGTEINDILLAGMALSLREWWGIEKVLINLEGHGREELLENINISRTVGWFTSQYPVLLKASRSREMDYLVKEVKETLRRVPQRGLGYGILKYLTAADKKGIFPSSLEAEIDFNYLGEFGRGLNNDIFQSSELKTGPSVSPEMEKKTVLDISGLTTQGQLMLFVSYNRYQYRRETMEGLATAFRSNLSALIDHCASREVKTLTPSDLTYNEFTIDELDILMGRWGELEDIYELAPMQAGMLFHALKEKSSTAYFQQTAFSLRGNIDGVLLKDAFRQLIDRYDVLRTVFYYENVHQPVQIVLKQCPSEFDFQDLQGFGEEEIERYGQEYYREDRERGFNLTGGPLTRLALLKTGGDSYRLVWSFHHILMDGWCLGIVFKELLYIYRCLREGVPVALASVARYRDYIKWLRVQETGAGMRYWQNYVDGYEQPVGLLRRLEMRPGDAYRLEEYTVCLDNSLWQEIKALLADWRVTVNTIMQTTWGILLQRYNNRDDVVFGAVTSGRPPGIEGIECMVGLFINTLPVRIKTKGKESFFRLLREVQADAVSSRAYEYISLADIQAGSLLKEALINHIMVFENYPLDKEIKNSLNPGEYGFTVVGLWAFEQTNYDFNITISPQNSLTIKFSYNASVYDRELVERTGAYLTNILLQVVKKPALETAEIEIITDEEKRRILNDFNDTAAAYPDNKTIHQFFEEQVERTPDNTALVGANRHLRVCPVSLSYRQLDAQSDLLAGFLIEKGVLPDSIVGIMMERSIEMIIGILGILKAGGAYLPIDPEYPRERIDYMLKDSGTKLMIGRAEERKSGRAEIVFSSFFFASSLPRFLASNSSNLAYVIYTSGSTGKPKGVMIEHRSLVNRLNWMQKHYPIGQGDTILHKTPFTFDVSVWEIFWWSMVGARVCLLAPGGEKDPGQIVSAVYRENVTVMHFVPSMLGAFLEYIEESGAAGRLHSLKQVIASGEALAVPQVSGFNKLLNKTRLANLYGPTEATIDVSYYDCPVERQIERIPIGKPIDNTCLIVLSKGGRLQPTRVPGELCIGGVGLARGYLNNPELTVDRFNRSYRTNKTYIFYKTGDLARWLDDGTIEFLGRMDHQVKIRGFRIETGEIENVLLRHGDVWAAVVLAKEEGYLCAYFTSEREIPASLLREFAAKALPEYMIPSYFIQMEKLPLTPNGKLDRKALPEPGQIMGRGYIAPTGRVEEKLAEIWAEVLGIPRETISAEANFFHLGGHSLRATVLMSKIHKYLDIKIPLEKIYKVPTIRGLAAYISSAAEDKFTPIPPAEEKEYYVLSASQDRFYMFQQLDRGATIYNMPEVVLLEGKLQRKRLEDVFLKLIARHESLRTSFIIVGGEVVQQIRRHVGFEIEYCNAATDEHGQKRTFLKEFMRPFDLSKAPLLRVGLIKEKEEEHILLVDTHHIISDGASQTILMKEFMDIFRGEEPTLTSGLRTRYKDYAEWQNTADMRKVLKMQEEYWLKEYAGAIPVANLPIDFERPEVMHFEGSMMDFEIEAAETAVLKRLASEEGVSLFGLLLTIVNVFLAKITRREDICIGTQVAGRRHPDLQGIIGVFLNSLALRNYPGQEITFKAFLNQVMERTLQAFENQEYRFEDLVEKVLGKREINRNPLFDVMLVWQNFERQEIQVPGLILKSYPHEHKSRALTDLSLYGWEMDEKLLFTFEYSTELFKKETVERFITYFKEIVSTIITNKEIKIGDIKISHDLGMAEPVLFRDSDDGFGF